LAWQQWRSAAALRDGTSTTLSGRKKTSGLASRTMMARACQAHYWRHSGCLVVQLAL
jgi:hypothetical protein